MNKVLAMKRAGEMKNGLAAESTYLVVLRAESRAKFPQDQQIVVENFPSRDRRVDVLFQTRYADEGFAAAVPRELMAEVRVTATSLLEAVETASNAANVLKSVIAFTANAWVEDLDVHLAYDMTPGHCEREFFESFLPDESGMPSPGRCINGATTIAFINAIKSHPKGERLRRAMVQYSLALSQLRPGREILALAHLFMGMEALTPVALRRELSTKGVSEEALAKSYGIDVENDACNRWRNGLAGIIRQKILFQGDQACYQAAKQASDGLEHGFLPFPDIWSRASESNELTARYLRSAIIGLADVPDDARERLLGAPYDRPFEVTPVSRYLRGHLISETDQLAREGQRYPLIRWKSSIKALRRIPSGEYQIEFNDRFESMLGEGVSFRPTSHEVWGPQQDPPVAEVT
jgi:hypothetical protein